ncbi:MAG: hypothetical protein EOO28_11330 [Comamonadaceae bacterium]|nr:MAG: hypothetical protein EOO28_11330 [Comamonadaceae bacterium]
MKHVAPTLVLLAALCASMVPLAVSAATARVDDTGTTLSQGVVTMRWRQLVPGRASDNTVQAGVRVALRLNLQRWLNQPVRLYMALPPATCEPVHAEWRTQGRLLPGSLRTGARTLIFDGVATAALLEETLDLTLRTDGRSLTSTQSLQFYFEIDTP